MIDKLIMFLSSYMAFKKRSKKSKIDYKKAYYELLDHIYKNDIHLIDRYVYPSPSRHIFATNKKEMLAIAMFDESKRKG